MIDAPLAAPTAAVDRRLRKPRRRRFRRAFVIGVIWAIAVLGMGWLLLAGIVGFAHA